MWLLFIIETCDFGVGCFNQGVFIYYTLRLTTLPYACPSHDDCARVASSEQLKTGKGKCFPNPLLKNPTERQRFVLIEDGEVDVAPRACYNYTEAKKGVSVSESVSEVVDVWAGPWRECKYGSTLYFNHRSRSKKDEEPRLRTVVGLTDGIRVTPFIASTIGLTSNQPVPRPPRTATTYEVTHLVIAHTKKKESIQVAGLENVLPHGCNPHVKSVSQEGNRYYNGSGFVNVKPVSKDG